jgi:hypothetical protein
MKNDMNDKKYRVYIKDIDVQIPEEYFASITKNPEVLDETIAQIRKTFPDSEFILEPSYRVTMVLKDGIDGKDGFTKRENGNPESSGPIFYTINKDAYHTKMVEYPVMVVMAPNEEEAEAIYEWGMEVNPYLIQKILVCEVGNESMENSTGK